MLTGKCDLAILFGMTPTQILVRQYTGILLLTSFHKYLDKNTSRSLHDLDAASGSTNQIYLHLKLQIILLPLALSNLLGQDENPRI